METAQQTLASGTRLNQFEILGLLGAGGFGITYRARDHELHRDVAIKEFLPAELAVRDTTTTVIKARESRADDYRYGLERFLDEARTLAQFDHTNIIRVHNFFKANGTAYLVMPFVEGETLADRLTAGDNRLDETSIRELLPPLLQGLATVHDGDFLHRDIKPGNIYLRRNGEPLLIDFGAARQALGAHSRSVTGIVSAGYAPPEQYSTDPSKQGAWTDLYALGATLYRCIGGDPVDSPTRQHALMEGDADPLTPAIKVGRGRYSPNLLRLIDHLL